GRSQLMSALEQILPWPAKPIDRYRLALWTSAEIADATGGNPRGPLPCAGATARGPFQVAGVETDSREVRPGDLFVALKGESTDGHRFLDKAFANGAAAALVEHPIAAPHVLVDDTTRALEALGAFARERVA